MQNPERKYQLFPKDRQATAAPDKAVDPGQAYALAMSQSGDKSEKMTAVTGLRIRIKEHHNLIRRRKISVPELSPMTTVQEVSMDSRMPTPDHASTRSLLTMLPSYHSGTAANSREIHQCSWELLEAVFSCRLHGNRPGAYTRRETRASISLQKQRRTTAVPEGCSTAFIPKDVDTTRDTDFHRSRTALGAAGVRQPTDVWHHAYRAANAPGAA